MLIHVWLLVSKNVARMVLLAWGYLNSQYSREPTIPREDIIMFQYLNANQNNIHEFTYEKILHNWSMETVQGIIFSSTAELIKRQK